MRIILFLILLVGAVSCAKHTTPRKVEKRLTQGTWLITDFIDNNQSILKSYKDVSLIFNSNGAVLTTSKSSVQGTWYTGSNRTPAVIYINLAAVDSMHLISDDWVVYSLNKTECILKRNMGSSDGEDEFDYDKSYDQLTLTKK